MMKQFWLKLKSQRYLLPLLVLIVLFQLLMAQTSSYVLSESVPPLSLAVQQLSDDELSNELVFDLAQVSSFEVVDVDAALKPDEVFRQQRVQGLLVVSQDFNERLTAGNRAAVTLYSAPGITNSEFAREQVAEAIMQLRARFALTSALDSLGLETTFGSEIPTTDLLDVVYEGPLLQGSTDGSSSAQLASAAPVFGVAALLLLLAFLHAALSVPTRDDKRILMRGRRTYAQQLCVSLLVVWVVWLLVIALYVAATTLLVGKAPGALTCLGFIAIMIYCSVLGALLAQFMGRHTASWVFLPLFLFSMTIGGGLWVNITLSPLFSPLVPVACVVTSGSAALLGITILFAAALLMMIALVLALFLTVPRVSRTP
ncbi:MAG: hypothetical protein LBB42_04880 [Coriobacteriales bacterium]|nr:hypothetical protein [Coriobacteriales bacterium]